MDATVSEIHGYPSRSEGFTEPLFRTRESAEEIMEHFLASPWLGRASELARTTEQTSSGAGHAFGGDRIESVRVRRSTDGRVELLRGCGRRRTTRKLVVGLAERWREVRGWWRSGGGTDRHVYRLVLSDGSVVDVARERHSGGRGAWTLVGIVD